jgi:hypothetical protein
LGLKITNHTKLLAINEQSTETRPNLPNHSVASKTPQLQPLASPNPIFFNSHICFSIFMILLKKKKGFLAFLIKNFHSLQENNLTPNHGKNPNT